MPSRQSKLFTFTTSTDDCSLVSSKDFAETGVLRSYDERVRAERDVSMSFMSRVQSTVIQLSSILFKEGSVNAGTSQADTPIAKTDSIAVQEEIDHSEASISIDPVTPEVIQQSSRKVEMYGFTIGIHTKEAKPLGIEGQITILLESQVTLIQIQRYPGKVPSANAEEFRKNGYGGRQLEFRMQTLPSKSFPDADLNQAVTQVFTHLCYDRKWWEDPNSSTSDWAEGIKNPKKPWFKSALRKAVSEAVTVGLKGEYRKVKIA